MYDYSEDKILIAKIVPARIEHKIPSAYRLCVKKNGEMVLRGAFMWECGYEIGEDWKDIPTVIEDTP